jgi:hypothetical protein
MSTTYWSHVMIIADGATDLDEDDEANFVISKIAELGPLGAFSLGALELSAYRLTAHEVLGLDPSTSFGELAEKALWLDIQDQVQKNRRGGDLESYDVPFEGACGREYYQVWAEDEHHAIEQCFDANPGAFVGWPLLTEKAAIWRAELDPREVEE